MAKNWRLAVCRSRLVLALVALAMSWLLLTSALIAFQKYQAFRFEQKAKLLKVGMSYEELVQIVGLPLSDEVLADSTDGTLRRLDYLPKWGPFGSNNYRTWRVMVRDDDNGPKRIDEIAPGGFGLVDVDHSVGYKAVAGVTIVGLALAIWLLFLRWCRRVRVSQTGKDMT